MTSVPEQFYISSSLVTDIDNVYPLEPGPPGVCLIINNCEFRRPSNGSSEDHRRAGSSEDVKRFKRIFQNFCFELIEKENLTAKEMETCIIDSVKEERIKNANSFVLIVLTHGARNGVCGSDYEVLSYKEIKELLSNNNCKALRHKPRICFFQACHGRKKSILQTDNYESYGDRENGKQMRLDLPPCSDLLMSFAAQGGYKTLRHPCLGGIYARHLASVLEIHAKTCDLEQMLKFVEMKIRNDVYVKVNCPDTCPSTMWVTYGWSKRFYFYPIKQDLQTDQNVNNTVDLPETAEIVEVPVEPSIIETAIIEEQLWVVGGSQPPEYFIPNSKSWTLPEGTGLSWNYQGICKSNGQIFLLDQNSIMSWNYCSYPTQLTDFRMQKLLYAYAMVGENIYIMGGLISGKDTDDCFVYNCRTGLLENINHVMSRKTSGRNAVVLEDKIYTTSGKKKQESVRLDMLNPQNLTWHHNIGESMKYCRYGHAIATCGTYIWVFGGKNNNLVCNYVEKYDIVSGEWKVMAPMLTARENLSVTYFQGKFYAIGGSDGNGKELDVVEIYNPDTMKWTKGRRLNKARSGHTSIVLP